MFLVGDVIVVPRFILYCFLAELMLEEGLSEDVVSKILSGVDFLLADSYLC